MRKWLKKFLLWILKDDNTFLRTSHMYEVGSVGVDVHHAEPSWAVVNIKGDKRHYLKFIDLKDADVDAIIKFLREFERYNDIVVDAHPCERNIIMQTINW